MLAWPVHDLLVIAGAVLVLVLPGLAVVVLSGRPTRNRALVALGAAPVVTAGLAYLTAALTAVTGMRFGLPTFLVVTVLVAAAAFALGRPGPREDGAGVSAFGPETAGRLPLVAGGAATLFAMALTLHTWGVGLGNLAVVPQEHDTVTHTLLTARIARTGEAAPWQAWPADLLSGQPDMFYPSGFHSLAALVTSFGVDPVSALNAMSVAFFAVALPLGILGLGSLLRWRGLGPVVGGAGAVVGSLAYRPVYAMMHDGGILSNAAGVALTGGAVAGLVVSGVRLRRELLPNVLIMVGIVFVYPSSAAGVLLGVLAWAVGGALGRRTGLAQLRPWALSVAAAGGVSLVLALPTFLAGSGSGEFVTTFPRDAPVWSFWQAIGIAVGMPYGGYLDPEWQKSQTILAALTLVGAAASLFLRRHAGLVLAWLGTTVLFLLFALDAGGPLVGLVTGVFYRSYVRIAALMAIYQWLLAGVAIVAGGVGAAWLLSRIRSGRVRLPSVERIAVVVSLALAAGVAVAGADYRHVNAAALQGRYRHPDFARVDGDDRAAIDFLKQHVRPGERVMNNANDGSTYLYVYAGVPVVNVQTLGGSADTKELLARMDEIDHDPEIRALVRELNIRWVYADAEAPPISAPSSETWLSESVYSVAPGFAQLDQAESLEPVFSEGSVTVYEVDPSVFAG